MNHVQVMFGGHNQLESQRISSYIIKFTRCIDEKVIASFQRRRLTTIVFQDDSIPTTSSMQKKHAGIVVQDSLVLAMNMNKLHVNLLGWVLECSYPPLPFSPLKDQWYFPGGFCC